MKVMPKWYAAMVMVLALTPALAQPPGGAGDRQGRPGPMGGPQMMGGLLLGSAGMLEPALPVVFNLTEAQRQKIGETLRAAMQSDEFRGLRPEPGQRPTPEQRQKMMEQREKLMEALRKKVDPILTADQKKLRDKLMAASDKIMEALRKTMEQQGQNQDPQARGGAMRQAFEKARQDFGKSLDTILTPQQKQQLEAARKRMEEERGQGRRQGRQGGQGRRGQ